MTYPSAYGSNWSAGAGPMPRFRSEPLRPWTPVPYMGASVNPCGRGRTGGRDDFLICQLPKDHSDQHGAKFKMRLGGAEIWIYLKGD